MATMASRTHGDVVFSYVSLQTCEQVLQEELKATEKKIISSDYHRSGYGEKLSDAQKKQMDEKQSKRRAKVAILKRKLGIRK